MTDPADEHSAPLEIRVAEAGPYVVTGGVPLSRRRRVLSEEGEPLTWQTTEELDAPASYRLCRCGHSGTKPYCDNTHQRIEFDDSEPAGRAPYEEAAKEYPGTGVTVRDVRSLCQHAAFCANRETNVWKMTKRSEDTRVRAELMGMVERCPSGALTQQVGGEAVEPDLRPGIGVVDDGPLAVTGGPSGLVTVRHVDGTRESRPRMTLCRCGASANKPFCDGSHTEAEFHDSGPSRTV
ncbi:CDGSH iron-sulfur domain-containing protein [Nocardioides sp.]|uniref:CDGSH iron-sulfur domain-containing protein n=1 Tax=Nocardioides sp. TaxID=35761 RepID=UPI003567A69B